MVLQELLKVEYKIIFVSSGAELATKGRELSDHFATQGTPIMMGGGVLACVHTHPLNYLATPIACRTMTTPNNSHLSTLSEMVVLHLVGRASR